MRFLYMIAAQLLVAFCALNAAAQNKDIPVAPEDSADFDFSLFFTGNLQGNIEPCG